MPLVALLSAGCSTKPSASDAFHEILTEVRTKSEQHSAGEMISSLNATVVQHFPIRDVECPDSEGGMYARVSSPAMQENGLTRYDPSVQDWVIQIGCYEHPEFKNLDGKIDLHLESNGTTGIGTLSGGMTIKKLVRCQFDLDLIFDVATGQVLTIEGQVCDQSLVAEDLVVPFLL